jgi:hypothetical protein
MAAFGTISHNADLQSEVTIDELTTVASVWTGAVAQALQATDRRSLQHESEFTVLISNPSVA